jgi:histidine ammonia-lyase
MTAQTHSAIVSVTLSGEGLTLSQLVAIARENAKVDLAKSALVAVDAARACIDRRIASGAIFYGINTGFGALSDVHIPANKTKELQLNLIRSHACGVGDFLPRDVIRAVLTLRIQTMLRGNSGVRRVTVELMKEFLNRDICPIVPSKGSVGACGDLAPLAHVAMCLIGEGKVWYKNEIVEATYAMKAEGLTPCSPEAKEGLCLINGTQVMTSVGLLACADAQNLLTCADIAAAVTLDATRGTATAFRSEIQAVRPHATQEIVASNVRRLLENDNIRKSHESCTKVQDPYSLRCVPQVHGAARTAFAHVLGVLLTEANSSTDNPLVFPETDEILSGGNFHGEPVAMVLDYLAIAMSEIANISERRIEKLVNPHMSGLPPFLAADSGLNSGYMIPHCVAAALVSENKVLSHPASVDSIPTSAEKEDHVSMGMTSALKLRTILKNVAWVLSIETIAACDGLEFLAPLKGGNGVHATYQFVRTLCQAMKVDRSLSPEIERIAQAITAGELISSVENAIAHKLS